MEGSAISMVDITSENLNRTSKFPGRREPVAAIAPTQTTK